MFGTGCCIEETFKLTFQRNGLTRRIRLLREGKEKIQLADSGYQIHDAPSETKSPSFQPNLAMLFCAPPTPPFALGRSLCWKRW